MMDGMVKVAEDEDAAGTFESSWCSSSEPASLR